MAWVALLLAGSLYAGLRPSPGPARLALRILVPAVAAMLGLYLTVAR